MFFNRTFLIAILISAGVHAAILFQPSNLTLFFRNKENKKVEVSYLKIPQENNARNISVKSQLLPRVSAKQKTQGAPPPPYIDKSAIFRQDRYASGLPGPSFSKPALVNSDIVAVKKKIVIPPIDIQKINNPIYVSYYQMVREKIRHCAYNNFTQAEEGEVYLTFTVSSDGNIRDIHLVEEKSSSNPYLRKVGFASIKDASPFPNFPKELDYPQLTFNVIISFELE
jgi:TonB family protein